ncbi:hypothetical protein [Leeuwenhoekiella sp. MAR_2009_132]|uniref:hypothetical protein n=1 Tax=Leeuwenhoekiella sp. MAR_2009_132 TaxID=1392489 RepID=UPI00048AA1F4|nr:hypothetical protein [Leeuwenhoekiella sp. MAR_2009_132]
MKKYILFLAFLSLSCKENKPGNNPYNNSQEEKQYYYEDEEVEDGYYNEDEIDGYQDGTYSATVYYNNPETSYSATYTLDVEVEDNEVTVIYFPNDGYLDYDHIWPDELDDYGYVIISGEEGKTYEIQID